jgi:tetratricopeptide (TPR) repeat protein
VGARAIALATAAGDTDVAANTNFFLGTAHHTRGEFREAAACYRRCFAPIEGDVTPELARTLPLYAAGARGWLAWSLENLGEFREALLVGRQALQIAEARGGKLGEASNACLLANVHLGLGDWVPAIPLLEGALERCRAYALHDWLGPVAMRLGFAYALAGRPADGIPLLEEGAAHCEATHNLTGQPTRLAGLAHAYLLAGRLGDAEQTACRGVSLARTLSQPAGEAWCSWAAGAIAAAVKDGTVSETHFVHARDIAVTLGMRPLAAHCHFGLAKLYRTLGDVDEATRHIGLAMALYREMGMSIWLEAAAASHAG